MIELKTPDQSGTINSGGMTKTKSSWTEILIRSIPKLLVWIIAIGISGHVHDLSQIWTLNLLST